MKNKVKKVVKLLLALVIFISAFVITASAETQTQTIKIETRSVLLIDRSGSMEETQDRLAFEHYIREAYAPFDTVVYFDSKQMTSSADYKGGGNSSICEAIDELADAGFTHISVITDGEQWPRDYSSLSMYSDLDLTLYLVEETKASEELIEQLKSHLIKSNLKIVKPDGITEEVILNDYKEPIYTIEVPVVEDNNNTSSNVEDEDKTFIENIEEGYFPWWLILVIAALIAAFFDFIHELITCERNGEKKEQEEEQNDNSSETPIGHDPKPMPAKAVVQIAQGAHVVADFSGSMAAQQSETAKACRDAQKGSDSVICFGESVSEHVVDDLESIRAAGKTAGWEAIEQAAVKGWDEIVLVSDLGFNGKAFDEKAFSKKFNKITVVTPSNYNTTTLADLEKIADEVEVLPL